MNKQKNVNKIAKYCQANTRQDATNFFLISHAKVLTSGLTYDINREPVRALINLNLRGMHEVRCLGQRKDHSVSNATEGTDITQGEAAYQRSSHDNIFRRRLRYV
jgi:hypothetical protein